MQLAKILNWQLDILHTHDWHTAPAVYNLSLIREKDAFYQNTKSLLTVHNLPYLGQNTSSALRAFGLPRAQPSPLPCWAEILPLPLGLLYTDKINTVSSGYAKKMLTAEFGAKLKGFLKTSQQDITGILNGLDLVSLEPGTRPGNSGELFSGNPPQAQSE